MLAINGDLPNAYAIMQLPLLNKYLQRCVFQRKDLVGCIILDADVKTATAASTSTETCLPAYTFCEEIVLTAPALSHTLELHNHNPKSPPRRPRAATLLKGANAPLVRDAAFHILLR